MRVGAGIAIAVILIGARVQEGSGVVFRREQRIGAGTALQNRPVSVLLCSGESD